MIKIIRLLVRKTDNQTTLKLLEQCRTDITKFAKVFLDIEFTPLQKIMIKRLEKKTVKQKKRPKAILRWFRRMWCRMRGIPYIEVYGVGSKVRGRMTIPSVEERRVIESMIIIDDLEEEENNNAKNRVNNRTIK